MMRRPFICRRAIRNNIDSLKGMARKSTPTGSRARDGACQASPSGDGWIGNAIVHDFVVNPRRNCDRRETPSPPPPKPARPEVSVVCCLGSEGWLDRLPRECCPSDGAHCVAASEATGSTHCITVCCMASLFALRYRTSSVSALLAFSRMTFLSLDRVSMKTSL